jgi:hypothetical protein
MRIVNPVKAKSESMMTPASAEAVTKFWQFSSTGTIWKGKNEKEASETCVRVGVCHARGTLRSFLVPPVRTVRTKRHVTF